MYYIINKVKIRANALDKLYVHARQTPEPGFFELVFGNDLTTDNIFIFRNRLAYYLYDDRIYLSISSFRSFLKIINKI